MKYKLKEAAVTTQVRDFLKYRGWRAIRFQRFVVPGAGQSGEPGMPDFAFVRYMPAGAALWFWCEMKAQHKTDERCRCEERAMDGRSGVCTFCAQRNWRKREMALSQGRAVILRVAGLDRHVMRAGPYGDWSPAADTFDAFYAQAYGWLHGPERGIDQLRLEASHG